MARNIAVEWGPSHIRVNPIAPGLISTPFSRALTSDASNLARGLAATPLRRLGDPHEVACAALWLAPPGGAFTAEKTFVVDGATLVSDGV